MKTEIKQKGIELFTQVSNRAIRDEELGAVSLAIYTYIRSHCASSYKIYKKNVELRFKEIGRVSFNRAWKSLIDKGWLESKRVKDDQGRYTKWDHYVLVENDNYMIDEQGKSRRVTDMHIDDFRLDDSHETSGVNNTNVNNIKNKNNVSDETLCEFESFWIKAKEAYKKYNYNIGNKEPARKAFKRVKDVDLNYLNNQLIIQIERKALIKSSGEFTANPRNLSTWLNNKGWSEELESIPTVNNSFKTPPSFAQITQKKRKAFGQ